MVILNHNPVWKDTQVLLNTLLLSEEKLLILEKTNEENWKTNAREGLECFMPETEEVI